MSFPDGFVWGAAAASFQIEGGAGGDARGDSIWDAFCRKPGKVLEGHTGKVACDHYHRYEEDVRLMAELGIKAYRLSVSWPRVLPLGKGPINAIGIDFYDRLIDSLLDRGIDPWVTLFHWDFPTSLYLQGGWLNGDSPGWFADYVTAVVDRLSDRVSRWIPLNEPQVFLHVGHRRGLHAPGLELELEDLLQATHNALLAHGRAVQVIRARAKTSPRVGTANVGVTSLPENDHPEDVDAARERMFAVRQADCWNNTWFFDPMFLGEYPADGLSLFEPNMPKVADGDLALINQPLDFCGLNIYHGARVGAHDRTARHPAGHPRTTMDWPVTPDALYWGPRLFHERYGLPIVITENGMAGCDWVHRDGAVHDPQRVDFVARYLAELERAADHGVRVDGYFYWSILDNFEWERGYTQRFGLIHVDYATGRRTLKDSARWYEEVIRTNGAALNG